MAREGEAKVVFREGTDIRALRGVIIDEDVDFLCLKRQDSVVRLSKSIVLKIHEPIEESR